MPGEADKSRRVIALTGKDALPFLQGLVTNDVLPLTKSDGIVWAALLSPQGKYLADFFVLRTAAGLMLDLPEPLADATLRRLSMYRLRADVAFAATDLQVTRGLSDAPADALTDALADPRHPALGWRSYGTSATGDPGIDWDAICVQHLIPQTGSDLIPDETYVLEAGFERLHGVDFRKGCYVGQEVTARMKHKTDLRKGLTRLLIDGAAPIGSDITADGKTVGTLGTQSGGRALAHVRHDRIGGDMVAGSARLRADPTVTGSDSGAL